jgi:7-cyano-7-deazaguanine synthase in queuosine biosynthesis
MKNIKVLNTYINLHDGPIGVSLSGGADSSLLLYILMANVKEHIHVFTCSSKEKLYSTSISSVNVIRKCIELTGNNNINHHVHYVDKQKIENLFYEDQFKSINILYTAITSNPPKSITDKFSNNLTELDRNPETKKKFYSEKLEFYSPFVNIDKQQIHLMYKELNLLDTLFPVTRSCESKIQRTEHCGQCWWCEERLWAFGKL